VRCAIFVFGIVALAACSPQASESTGKTRVEERVEEPYVAIEGTRVELAPPRGFTTSAQVQGLAHADGTAKLGVFELPTSFEDALPKDWGASGMTLLREERVTIAGGDGRLYSYERADSRATKRGWMAVGGDASEALLLVAECDSARADELEEELRACLLGARWLRAENDAPRFELDPAEGLVLASDEGRSRVYVAAEAASPMPLGSPFLLVSASNSPVASSKLEDAAKERLLGALETVGAMVANYEHSAQLALGGVHGWELVARVHDARLEGDWLAYALLVPHARGSVCVLAHAGPAHFETMRSRFEQTAHSLRLR
jgi:hypothetical protein